MAMQLVGDRLQCAGDVADFSSSEGDEPQKAWLAAFTDELALPGYGGMRSVYTVFDGGDPQLAYTRAMQIMVAYPSLVGVVAFTPETTEQVVRAVHDADRVADIFVVSVTSTPGFIAAIAQPPRRMRVGFWTMSSAGRWLYGPLCP